MEFAPVMRSFFSRNIFNCPIKNVIFLVPFSGHLGSEILYHGNNNLSLPRFRPGGNDSKNRSELFSGSKKMRIIILLKTEDFREKINVL